MSILESSLIQDIINLPWISRVRRNHGLEHATLHILSERFPNTNLAGHSDRGGFWLLGEVPIETVQQAVEEALQRLRAGEKKLAVHDRCGTNFVTAGILAGLAGGSAMFGAGRRFRDKLERLPLSITMATLALIFSQPLGYKLQEEITTSGQPGDLEVIEIIANKQGRLNAYRVITRG